MNEYMTIRVDDFIILNEHVTKLDFLREALKSAARLNYKGDGLSFDTDILDTVFKCALPDLYKGTLNRLQTEKEAEIMKDEY